MVNVALPWLITRGQRKPFTPLAILSQRSNIFSLENPPRNSSSYSLSRSCCSCQAWITGLNAFLLNGSPCRRVPLNLGAAKFAKGAELDQPAQVGSSTRSTQSESTRSFPSRSGFTMQRWARETSGDPVFCHVSAGVHDLEKHAAAVKKCQWSFKWCLICLVFSNQFLFCMGK